MKRYIVWLMLLLLGGLFTGTAYFVLRARVDAGRDMPRYSVYSEEADGLAETARFLRKLDWEPIALTRPIRQLRASAVPRLLVMVEPQATGLSPLGASEFSPTEVRSLLRWVEEGNTLLLCGRHVSAIHTELGVALSADLTAAPEEAVREATVQDAGGYTEGIERLLVEGRDQVQSDRGLPLWTVDQRAGGLLLRRGRGRVLVLADPSLLTRRGLVREDNCLFLYNVVRLHAGDGKVYFDEYHHGLRSGGGFWGYWAYHQLHWTLLPVLAVILVAGWAAAVRLGPAVPQAPATQADAVNYASALARIYERAGVRHLLAEVLARDFLTHLTRPLRLRRSALPVEILAAWGKQRGTADQLTLVLRRVAELRRSNPSESQLLQSAREFDRFLKDQATV